MQRFTLVSAAVLSLTAAAPAQAQWLPAPSAQAGATAPAPPALAYGYVFAAPAPAAPQPAAYIVTPKPPTVLIWGPTPVGRSAAWLGRKLQALGTPHAWTIHHVTLTVQPVAAMPAPVPMPAAVVQPGYLAPRAPAREEAPPVPPIPAASPQAPALERARPLLDATPPRPLAAERDPAAVPASAPGQP